MVTNEKTVPAVDMDDNHNTRDQRNVGIWLVLMVLLFLSFLFMLGIGHKPAEKNAEGDTGTPAPGVSTNDEHFSVNAPVGEVELPGTLGKPQHFLSGHGNTPVPSQGVSPAVTPNEQSLSKPQSGAAPVPAAAH